MSLQDKCACLCKCCCCYNSNEETPDNNQFMLAPNVQSSNTEFYTGVRRFWTHTPRPSANVVATPQLETQQTISNDYLNNNNEDIQDNRNWLRSYIAQFVLAPNLFQPRDPGPQIGCLTSKPSGHVPAQLGGPQATLPSTISTKCKNTKKRTCFTSHQVLALERSFAQNQHMSRIERIKLAKALDLSEMQVKTWFQNRRTKQKTLVNENGMTFHEVYIKEESANDEDAS